MNCVRTPRAQHKRTSEKCAIYIAKVLTPLHAALNAYTPVACCDGIMISSSVKGYAHKLTNKNRHIREQNNELYANMGNVM